MTWYTFFKSIHVITAVIWVGGAVTIQAYAYRILRTGDARRQADFAKDTEIVSMRVFIPSTIVLFVAAIGLMENATGPGARTGPSLASSRSPCRLSSARATWARRVDASPR
jgi:uncharacterized membrane protein